MTPVPVWHAVVTPAGVLEMAPAERGLRRAYLKCLAGKPVDVVVRVHRKQRSKDQNAYIHAVPIPILAEHFGYTVPEMKLVLMGECWGWRMDKVSGKEIPINVHTSDMNTDECSQFIEWVIPWAMVNHEVAIPFPSEVSV